MREISGDELPFVGIVALVLVVVLSALVALCAQRSSEIDGHTTLAQSTTGTTDNRSSGIVRHSPQRMEGGPHYLAQRIPPDVGWENANPDHGIPPQPGLGNEGRDPAVDALLQAVHTVCGISNGYLVAGKRIKPGSIRVTSKAVILDVATNYSIEETALFYADKKLFQRHMKMQSIRSLEDVMPAVVNTYDESSHMGPGGMGETSLPAAIFFQKATPLAQRLAELHTPTEQTQELFAVWHALAEVLQSYHQSGWFVRNISKDNVVHVRRGTNAGWTLLEFGQAASKKSKLPPASIPVRSMPPELAEVILHGSGGNIQLTNKYDLWQLGVMVYEVYTGQKYWLPHVTDSEVLSVMANPYMLLPHQVRPIPEPRVQKVLEKLLQRDPSMRIDAQNLKKSLLIDLGTIIEQTLNGGPHGTSTVVEDIVHLEA